MKIKSEVEKKRYILFAENDFYNLCDHDNRILFRSYNLSIVLQYASALKKGGHIVNVSDDLKEEIGQGGVL